MRTRTDNSSMPRIGIAQIAIESKTCPSDSGKESYAYKQEYMMTGGHVNTYNYFSKDTFRGYKNEYNNPRAFGGVQPPFSLGNGEIQLFDILIPATIAIIPFVL